MTPYKVKKECLFKAVVSNIFGERQFLQIVENNFFVEDNFCRRQFFHGQKGEKATQIPSCVVPRGLVFLLLLSSSFLFTAIRGQ